MTSTVELIIGAAPDVPPSASPLCQVLERLIAHEQSTKAFLAKQPENLSVENVRITRITDTEVICACPFKATDHESLSFFQSDALFSVELSSGHCRRLA